MKVGETASITKVFTETDIASFAEITGDKNPIHLDEKFASTTRFKHRLVHGILVSGLISALLGMHLPGPGSIYIKQTLNFIAPVFINDRITATAVIISIRADKPIVTIDTICTNQKDEIVINGEAVLLVPGQESLEK
jgi:3-hydroxybutyryl-CoA dehydratase